MPQSWHFYMTIISFSWARGFRFKPGKPSKVRDWVLARRRYGLHSVWLQYSCWSRYTPLWGEDLFLWSRAVKRNPFSFCFHGGCENSLMRRGQGLVFSPEGSLALASQLPGSNLEAVVLASCALEPLSGIKTSDRVLPPHCKPVCRGSWGSVVMYACQLPRRRVCVLEMQVTALRGCRSAQCATVGACPPERIRGVASLFSLSSLPTRQWLTLDCSQGQSCLSRLCHNTEMMPELSQISARQTHGRQGESESKKCKFCSLQRIIISKNVTHAHTYGYVYIFRRRKRWEVGSWEFEILWEAILMTN